MNRTVKIVQEITPVFKNRIFIFVLCQLIVNIIKTDGLGIITIFHTTDTVFSHFSVWNRLLCGNLLFLISTLLIAVHFFCSTLFSTGFYGRGSCRFRSLFMLFLFFRLLLCCFFFTSSQLCFLLRTFFIFFFLCLMKFRFILLRFFPCPLLSST